MNFPLLSTITDCVTLLHCSGKIVTLKHAKNKKNCCLQFSSMADWFQNENSDTIIPAACKPNIFFMYIYVFSNYHHILEAIQCKHCVHLF